MSDPPPNGVTLTALRDLLVAQGDRIDQRLDRQAEHMAAQGGQLASIEVEVRTVRQGFVRQGLAIATLQQQFASRGAGCSARMQRQSDEIRRLGGSVESVEEVTGRHEVEELQRQAAEQARRELLAAAEARVERRRRLLRWALGALIAAGGAAVPLAIHLL